MKRNNKVYPLKIEDIVYPRGLVEEYYSQEDLINVVELIKSGDTTNMIVVKFSSNGYELVRGSVVFEAYKLLDRKIIPAYIQR